MRSSNPPESAQTERRRVHTAYAVAAFVAGVALLVAALVALLLGLWPTPSGPIGAGPSASPSGPATTGAPAPSSPVSTPPAATTTTQAAPTQEPGGTSGGEFDPDAPNLSVVIPPQCAQWALMPGPESGPVQFTDSKAQPVPGAREVRIMRIDKAGPLQGASTVIVFGCEGPRGKIQQSAGIYNTRGELIFDVEPWAGEDRSMLQAHVLQVEFTVVEASGTELALTLWEVLAAPDVGAESGTDAQAVIVLHWVPDGYKYATTRFYSDFGEWEQPKLWDLQLFYNALADGNDSAAAPHTSAENMTTVQTGCVGVCPDGVSNYRASIFPPGGVVEQCVLIGPFGVPISDVDGQGRRLGMEVTGEAGDFFCGIRRPAQDLNPDGSLSYLQWFIVQSPLDGDYYVSQFGRAFG
ncbi:hypothetical protein ABYF34_07265 [Buchananella felis]|uniref:hypothetical protein n=1 Tax=Buchananella felis TaxID=3231492 RepID=UPI003528FDF4